MLFIHRQYGAPSAQLAVRPDLIVAPPHREERVVIPIPGLTRAVVQAVNVGPLDQRRRPGGLHLGGPRGRGRGPRAEWERQVPGVPLVVVESPYRALVGPLLAYLDVLDRAWPPDKPAPITFVVIPEYVARHWWERILYNQSAKRLRAVLARAAAHGRRERARTGARTRPSSSRRRRRAGRRPADPPDGRRPARGRRPTAGLTAVADRRVPVVS